MRRVSPILQSQTTECGLACLAMIARAHGKAVDLVELRQQFPVSLKGLGLQQLIGIANSLGFACRPLRLELEELRALQTPCILHWDFNHFVVLQRVKRHAIEIIDPAVGSRTLQLREVSRHFTGIALELTATAEFIARKPRQLISLSRLTGRVVGLRGSLLQLLIIAFVLELFAIVTPLFQQLVVDDVLSSGDNDLLTVLALGFGLLLLIQTALGLFRSWMVLLLSQSLSLQWSSNVFGHLVRLPVEFFTRRHLGDIVSRFDAVGDIQKTLTTRAIEAVLDGIMGVAAMAMMIAYSPKLAAIVGMAVSLYGILRWSAYGPFRHAAAERLIVSARERTHFLETVRAIEPLKLFGREQERRARWQNLIVEVQNRDLRTGRLAIGFHTSNALIFGIENLLVLWLGAKYVLQGQAAAVTLTVGMLFAFIAYKNQFTGRLSSLIDYIVELKMIALHSERLADIALAEPEQSSSAESSLDHLPASLELRNISFRYGVGEPWLLRNVNLRVAVGESVAITGASGSGKTTLLRIALGLLSPTEGEVLYGGIPITQLGINNVRRCFGTVMQEDVLLTGSLADNIAFFDVHPDQDRLKACARLAHLHDDISRMPMGYQTLVGDLGTGLSGGQRQRLLLARALYKQPKLLVLDEATSHLDVENERAIAKVLRAMHLTRLIIAHRPETIAGAQRVVRLHDNHLMEVARAVNETEYGVGRNRQDSDSVV